MKTLRCLVGRHRMVLSFVSGRMFLSCMDCPHQTPGWRVTPSSAATSTPRSGAVASLPSSARAQQDAANTFHAGEA